MTLTNLINQTNYHFFFLVVDPQLDIDPVGINHFTSISSSKLNLDLPKNSGRLLSHPSVIDYINQQCQSSGRRAAIIPFKPSAKIDTICRQQKWLLIANPGRLNRLLEDKIKFSQICDRHHLPTLPHQVAALTESEFKSAQNRFGPKLVIQTHFGWAGNSTHPADNWTAISQLIAPNTLVKISPFLNGYSLLNNCCLTGRGLIQSPPALQYTGLKSLTSNPFATVGRQWPSTVSADIQKQVVTITNNFSKILSSLKYLGYFGLDFFVYQNQVYLLECNPRLTASFAFYHQIETRASLEPLFYFHLAEFLNLNFQLDPDQDQLRFLNQNLIGSEITLKNKSGTTVKKYHDFIQFSPSASTISIPPAILRQVGHV